MSPVQEHPQSMLFWAAAGQRVLHEAGAYVAFGLNLWDPSFLPSTYLLWGSLAGVPWLSRTICGSISYLRLQVWSGTPERTCENLLCFAHHRSWGERRFWWGMDLVTGWVELAGSSWAQVLGSSEWLREAGALPGEQSLLNRYIF